MILSLLQELKLTAVKNGMGIDVACWGETFDGTTPERSHSTATNL
jgi:hypothetical protein